MAFQARAERRLAEHDERLTAPLRRDLARAKRSLAYQRLILSEERRRAREALAELERTVDEFAHRDPYARYPVIVALLRAQRALGGE